MSYFKRMLPCPCRTWRCRAFYAGRILGIPALIIDFYAAYKFGMF